MEDEEARIEAEALPDVKDADFYVDIMKEVELGPKIGSGHFSSVFIGRYFGDYVAVKKQLREEKQLDRYLLRELSVLKYMNHPNLLEYIGAQNVTEDEAKDGGEATTPRMRNKFTLYIVTELARGGDFLGLLLDSERPLSWAWRTHMLRDAADALAYLHEHNLVHRDIKGANLLLDINPNGRWVCKVSDFGMTRPMAAVEEKRRLTICGTEDYMAPELLFDEEYGAAADVFSLGMVVLESLARQGIGNAGSTGFAMRTPANRFELDVEELKEEFNADAPASLIMLAQQCLCYESDERLGATDVKEWLEGIIDDEFGGADATYDSPEPPPLPSFGEEVSRRESSTELPAPPDLSDVESSHPGVPLPVLKAGWLYKRNRHGFRHFKKRWFVLTSKELMWYTHREDDEPKGVVSLYNCTLVKVIANRWQIIDTTETAEVADSRLHNRELSSETKKEMNEWLDVMKSVIDKLNEEMHGTAESQPHAQARLRGEELSKEAVDALRAAAEAAQHALETKSIEDQITAAELAAVAAQTASRAAVIREALGSTATMEGAAAAGAEYMRLGNLKPNAASGSIGGAEEWLASYGLETLKGKLAAAGITTVQQLDQLGLETDADLGFLGIAAAEDRARLLDAIKASGLGQFRPKLVIDCDGWQEFGDVTVYRFSAVYGLTKSQIYLRYNEFVKVNKDLRSAFGSEVAAQMPALPGKGIKFLQRQHDLAFILQRKEGLLKYLRGVVELAERAQGAPLECILRFLRLMDPRRDDDKLFGKV